MCNCAVGGVVALAAFATCLMGCLRNYFGCSTTITAALLAGLEPSDLQASDCHHRMRTCLPDSLQDTSKFCGGGAILSKGSNVVHAGKATYQGNMADIRGEYSN
jgi:hypothetical protein